MMTYKIQNKFRINTLIRVQINLSIKSDYINYILGYKANKLSPKNKTYSYLWSNKRQYQANKRKQFIFFDI